MKNRPNNEADVPRALQENKGKKKKCKHPSGLISNQRIICSECGFTYWL